MFVIGTAGHIDYGKSALILALTGIDPDRLPEEKKRGMTIDLGFAWFSLPSGERIGIVDVPGHKDFISNVIPGVGGIDAALIVIAADDGWMPQTEEHLQILNLLDIKHGVGFMCQQNMLIELPEGILLERNYYQNIKTEIINFLRSNGAISIQQVRVLFGFSRKHILPLLSKLEEEKVIRRQGDIRVLVETQ